jgi:hypothetical protein
VVQVVIVMDLMAKNTRMTSMVVAGITIMALGYMIVELQGF